MVKLEATDYPSDNQPVAVDSLLRSIKSDAQALSGQRNQTITADTGSLSAAARGLGLTPAAASIALKRLETRLGIRLLARSTRSMRLTEEGRRYLESVRVALEALSEGEQAIKQQGQSLSGLLQLAAPSDFGRNVLLGWLDEFKLEHPNIRKIKELGMKIDGDEDDGDDA